MKQLLTVTTSIVLAFSSLESMAAVDLILHNAKIYTAEALHDTQVLKTFSASREVFTRKP